MSVETSQVLDYDSPRDNEATRFHLDVRYFWERWGYALSGALFAVASRCCNCFVCWQAVRHHANRDWRFLPEAQTLYRARPYDTYERLPGRNETHRDYRRPYRS